LRQPRKTRSDAQILGARHDEPAARHGGPPDRDTAAIRDELVREARSRHLLPLTTLEALLSTTSPAAGMVADPGCEPWLLVELVVRADRRRRRLARQRFGNIFLRRLTSTLLAPVERCDAVASTACEFAVGPLRHAPAIRVEDLLYWAMFGDAVVAALADPRSRGRTLGLVESGQLGSHIRTVSAELGIAAELPVQVLDDDGWLTSLLGSPAEALAIPGHAILLGASAGVSTVAARRRRQLSRVLVHELVHAGQRVGANGPLPAPMASAQTLLVEGATEIVTNRIIAAAHREAENAGRSPYTPDVLSDVAYRFYVVLCSAVLQVSFLTEVPPDAAVELCTSEDPLRLVRDWIGGSDPADRAAVIGELGRLATEASGSPDTPEARSQLRRHALTRLGATRRRRGLSARETYNLHYVITKTNERIG
jgi:hypothetical protein